MRPGTNLITKRSRKGKKFSSPDNIISTDSVPSGLSAVEFSTNFRLDPQCGRFFLYQNGVKKEDWKILSFKLLLRLHFILKKTFVA